MSLISTITRDHKALEAIIRANVKKTGVTVTKLTLKGNRDQDGIFPFANLTVKTLQGDRAELSISSEQLMDWFDDGLRRSGYQNFARPHLIQPAGDYEEGRTISNLKMVSFIDLEKN